MLTSPRRCTYLTLKHRPGPSRLTLHLKGMGNNLRVDTIGHKSLTGHDWMHNGRGLRCEAQSSIIPPAYSRM